MLSVPGDRRRLVRPDLDLERFEVRTLHTCADVRGQTLLMKANLSQTLSAGESTISAAAIPR